VIGLIVADKKGQHKASWFGIGA